VDNLTSADDGPVGPVVGIDEGAVGEWLAVNIPELIGPFTYEVIAGGRSNLTYAVTDAAGRRFVLRRPPLSHVIATAHDMAREHRIIAAVGPTTVPVAPTLGFCPDPAVNGAPFFVMDFVDGEVLNDPEKARPLDEATRTRLSHDLIEVLARLHLLDVDEIGLGDLGPREAYVERQLRRWTRQLEAVKTRDSTALEDIGRRLAAAVPEHGRHARKNGVYRNGN
jgi:aminoglycoside phosphotransferase (APT) family kinase protein